MKTFTSILKVFIMTFVIICFSTKLGATYRSVSATTITNSTIEWSEDTIYISGNVTVSTNAKLKITGKLVRFTGYFSISVINNGVLNAIGGINDTVLFTRKRPSFTTDTSNFYRTDITNGSWAGININSTSTDTFTFKYCKFEFIKNITNPYFGIHFKGKRLEISYSAYRYNMGSIADTAYNSSISINNTVFSQNYYFCNTDVVFYRDIYIYNANTVSLKNNTFYSSSYNTLNLSVVSNLEITNNLLYITARKIGTTVTPTIINLSNITTCNISNNTITKTNGKPGGGIVVVSSHAIINSNIISNITTSGYTNPGISVTASTGKIESNNITNCTNGIDCSSSNFNVNGNTISNCTRGAFFHGLCIDTLQNNIFKFCTQKGLESNQATLEVINCGVTNNKFFGVLSTKSTINLKNCLIANNSSGNYGSAITALYSTLNIINSTIANNIDSTNSNAPVLFTSTTGDIINTIFWGNAYRSTSRQIGFTDNDLQPSFYNCDIKGGSASFVLPVGGSFFGAYNSCIADSPLFTNQTLPGSAYDAFGAGIDWKLKTTSPCVNNGLTSQNTTLTDFIGTQRVMNGIIDIGAFETYIEKTTYSGADITGSVRWMNDTIIIPNTFNITNTGALTIDPGVVVVFNGTYYINCNGLIKAVGTEKSQIIFTRNDTNSFYLPGVYTGGWIGISVGMDDTETDTTTFKYCNFKYIKGSFSIQERNKATIENCKFEYANSQNTSISYLYFQNCILKFKNNIIHDIKNYSNIYYCRYSTVEISNNLFYNNKRYNSFFDLTENDIQITQNKIINNDCYTGSPYLFSLSKCKSSITNNLISNNKSGTIINNTLGGDCYIANNTIARNYNYDYVLNLENSTIENNIIVDNRIKILNMYTAFPSTLRNNFISESTVINNATCTNCLISSLPKFVAPSGTEGVIATNDALNSNWRLTQFSQAINTGYSDVSKLLSTDLDNNPRVHASTVDMGAYENQGSIPTILVQPIAVDTCSGKRIRLSIFTSDTAIYQWKKNGIAISSLSNQSAKKDTLVLNSLNVSDDGLYTCEVSNSFGSVISNPTTVSVKTPPTIVSPESRFVIEGSPVIIPVSVSGTEPINYQWYRNNVAISGQDTSVLSIPVFSLSNDGVYKLVASNDCGSVTSNQFAINTTPIASVTGTQCTGQNLSFTVTSSTGSTYQWRKDGVAISGATNTSYTINGTTTNNSGIYTCYVSNVYQNAESNPVLISVNQAPDIVSQPAPALVTSGSDVPLSVAATGSAPFTYQWYKGAATIGTNSSTYTITGFNASKEGAYSCTVTNNCGSDATGNIFFYIEPGISIVGNDGLYCKGENIQFQVQGNFTATYQWYKDGSALSGKISSLLEITSTVLNDAGSYYCLVTSVYGIKTTNTISIAISEAPEILVQPTSQWALLGSAYELNVTASGTKPLNYEWFKNSVSQGVSSNSQFIKASFVATDSGNYYCRVSNTCGNVNSGKAYVFSSPRITLNPDISSPCEGTTVELSAESGTGSTYQWYKDGAAISGKTSATLLLNNIATTNSGNYSCLVTKSGQSKSTETRTISVLTAPDIALNPSSQWTVAGNTYTVEISANGSKPIDYQWYKDAVSQSGKTTNNWTLSNFQPANEGYYYCTAHNTCGTATSNTAYIYISPKITVTINNGHTIPCESDKVTLDASSGIGATYQWYKDGIAVTDSTNAVYRLASISQTNAGNYYCQVTRNGISKQTETKTIAVQTAPSVLVQPTSQWAVAGNGYTVEIVTNGSTPLNYKWYKDGSEAGGTNTNTNYIIMGFASANEGRYYCQVSNVCGTKTSADAYLYITPKIAITNNNSHEIPCETDVVTLDANSGGSASYKWYKDGSVLSGATNSSYQISGITQTNAGNYYCEVTRSGQTKQTEIKTIAVQTAPSVLVQPTSQWAVAGNGYTVEVVSNGSSPLNYKWYKDGSEAGGTNTNTNYIIMGFASANEGRYYCQVSNVCGTKTTSDAYLYITPKITVTNNNSHEIPCETDVVTLDANSGGSATYKWYKDGSVLSGATNFSYQISGITQTNAGNYYCEVTRSGQTKQTEIKTIAVQTAPEILMQPSSQWTTKNLTYTLEISSTGSKPLDYQWYKDGTLQTSKTLNNITLANFQTSDEGFYYCIAHNVCGTATSSNAYMYISPKLTLTNNNGHSTFCESDTVNLSAFSGAGASYKWFKNGIEISGETLSSLTFDSVTIADEGSYYCEVYRSGIMKQTETRVVTMQTLPEIVTQPISQWVTSGKDYTAEVSVIGSKPYVYQWYRDNTDINGDAARYTLTGFSLANEGKYKCKVTNACGVAVSNEAFMYITPSITLANESGHTVPCEGDKITLNVAAGAGASFQWYKDGSTIANTTSSIVFNSVSINDEGTYFCQVTINGQTKSTDVKSIFVQSAPEILLSPISQWTALGEGYTLELTAQGSKPLNYQWYKNGTEKSGETGSRYNLTSFALPDEAVYYCKVSNACGTAESDSAFVYVYPSITLTNKGHAVPCEGDTSILSVSAGNNVTYQWFKDGISIANTTTTLNLDSLTADDEGIYYCQVTRNGQTKATSSKTITIQTAPEILLSPMSQWATEGETYSLDVSVLGSKPLNFQWYKNNASIGDNSSSYILANFNNSSEGKYRCKVSNYCGTIETSDAYVYITPRMTVTNLNGKAIPCDGDTVVFNAFSGVGATYQWYKDGNAIKDSTRAQLVYNKMSKENEGTFYCNVSRGTFSKATESKIVFIAYAPEIFVQPSSQWVSKDGDYTLEVAASGSKPLFYNWYRNDTLRNGADGSRYVIAGIKLTDEGIYRCNISNACGVEKSTSVFVYIDPQIKVNNLSSHNVICEKDVVELNANSGPKASYQWYKDGSTIAGATSAKIVYNGVSASETGNYYCLVTKGFQSKPSENRIISVNSAPNILAQPQSQWIFDSSTFKLNVIAEGSKPLNYAWTKDNVALDDSLAELSFDNFTNAGEGNYFCKVSNSCGSSISNVANLKVAPELINPSESSVCEKDTFELEVVFNDVAKYQWYKEGKAINNATGKSFIIQSAGYSDIGNYQCRVSNTSGYIVLGPVQLTLRKAPSVEILAPVTYVDATLSVTIETQVTGDEPILYQWQKNGEVLSNSTAGNLSLSAVTKDDEAIYKCKISSSCDTTETNETKLVIAPQLCMVTNSFETDSNSNFLIWDRNSSNTYDHYNVYRESYIRDKYDKIGEVPYTALTTFIDESVNPKSQAYMYKITAVDASNNETDINATAPHKTIHLLVTQGIPSGIQLDWDEYIGFDYNTYSIYRSEDDAPFDSIYSMSSTSRTWTDNNAPMTINLKYFVSVSRDIACYADELKKAGAGPFASAVSNMEDNSRLKFSSTAISDVKTYSFSVYPNPFNLVAQLKYRLKKQSDVNITITDMSGRQVEKLINAKQLSGDYTLQLGENFYPGVYLLNVRINNENKVVQLLKTK
jgi:hypothetical protein